MILLFVGVLGLVFFFFLLDGGKRHWADVLCDRLETTLL